jgi:hypothetical protein
MVDKNDSLLREVEEELRHDQLKKLWADYGTYLLGAAVAVVAGVAIYQQVEASRKSAAQIAGARYESARRLLADNKAPEAAAAFADIAKTGPAGYATLARFQTAAALVKGDKTTEAVAAYDAVVADAAADPVSRDFARMQAAALRLESADWTEMQNRLTLLIDERNAFRANARELLGLAAQKAGKVDDARKLFLQIVGDGKASQALKDRVSGYLAAIVSADLGKTSASPDGAAKSPPAVASPQK